MRIIEVETRNRSLVTSFLQFPFRLYREVPQWVPPLAMDARRMLDRRRHPFYRHSDAIFLLAENEAGLPVGRLAFLDNCNYNDFNRERTAFFFLFECEENREAALGLFEAGFAWARARGLTKVMGPRGFTPFDGLGLLTAGFEHRPAFGIPYNLPYYAALLEAAGFQVVEEIVSGYMSRDAPIPERIHRVAEAVQRRRGLKVARYTSRAELRALAPRLKDLYNGAMGEGAGNVPLTDEEAKTMADQVLWFADPRLIKVIMKDGLPVGFLFAYPDISAALQRSGGKLLPIGWLDLLLEFRRTEWIDINGAGIIEKYRGLGGTALLFSEMQKSVRESKYKHTEIVQIGLANDKMQRELRDLGIDFRKRHCTYARDL